MQEVHIRRHNFPFQRAAFQSHKERGDALNKKANEIVLAQVDTLRFDG